MKLCECEYCLELPKTGKIWVPDLDTHFVSATRYNEGIAGWYVWEPEAATWPSRPVWNNCGNGPELQADNIYGPFKSELGAIRYVRSMFANENGEKND